jgi:hypothetical protein
MIDDALGQITVLKTSAAEGNFGRENGGLAKTSTRHVVKTSSDEGRLTHCDPIL